jgi:hypothetical protein
MRRRGIASGFRFSVSANCRSLHCATPDFLSKLVASAISMRLSSLKAAHAAVGECRVTGIRVHSGRDDKVEGGLPWHGRRWMDGNQRNRKQPGPTQGSTGVLGYSQQPPSPFDKLRAVPPGLNLPRAFLTLKPAPLQRRSFFRNLFQLSQSCQHAGRMPTIWRTPVW